MLLHTVPAGTAADGYDAARVVCMTAPAQNDLPQAQQRRLTQNRWTCPQINAEHKACKDSAMAAQESRRRPWLSQQLTQAGLCPTPAACTHARTAHCAVQ